MVWRRGGSIVHAAAKLAFLPLVTLALTACRGEGDAGPPGTAERIPIEAFEYELVFRLEPVLQPVSYEHGAAEFVLENIGEERHELRIMRLDEGRTLEEWLDYTGDEGAVTPPDWVMVEASTSAEPGERSETIAVQLVSGQYTLACFLSTDDGVSHASLGMTKTFTVG